MSLMRPGFGIPQPNAEAIRAGIHFALDFSHPEALPWIRGGAGAAAGTFQLGATRDTTRRGWGMVGTNGYWRVPIGTATYSLPTTQGTILFCAVSATASNDATFPRRYMWAFGRGDGGWPASPWCGMADFDGQIIGGWANGGVDGRLSASSSGGAAWPANSSPLIGLSYGPSGQSLYYNGAFAGSNSFANFGDTSAQYLSVGDGELNIWWNRSPGDAILYLLVFDQEFTPGQHARAAIDPWWWLDSVPSSGPKWALAPFFASHATHIAVANSASGGVVVASSSASTIAVSGAAAGAMSVSAAASVVMGAASVATVMAAFSASASQTVAIASGSVAGVSVAAQSAAIIGIASEAYVLSGAGPISWPSWVPEGRRVAIPMDVRAVSIPTDRRRVGIPGDRRSTPITT